MAQKVSVPEELPQLAAQTTPDRPWPLHVLPMKIREYVTAMSRLWVEGEAITLQCRPGAKVQFFILRDLEANVSITVKVMAYLLPATIEPGNRAVVYAKPDFYEVNGSLSLWTDKVRPVGLGDVLARVEQLKSQLAAEGLFSAEHRKKVPFLPGRIGLIRGHSTKAREDVLVSVPDRWPAVRFDVREVRVQGEDAVEAMIEALGSLEETPGVDVVVFAHSGGSVKGPLPFSDERLVRVIVRAKEPVVSAVGHEDDSPILDPITNLRVSTPTDAAKRIVLSIIGELAAIAEATCRGRSTVQASLDRAQDELDPIRARSTLTFPEAVVDMHEGDLLSLTQRMRTHIDHAITDAVGELVVVIVNLRAPSPRTTLDCEYSILLSEGSVISSAAAARKDQEVEAILARGRLVLAVVTIAEQDGAATEKGLAVNQDSLTTAAPQGGRHAQEERP